MAAVDDARFDAVIIGAGFSGLSVLYELRRQGLRTIVLERADAVGGTWLVNRYPGARCDIESIEYSYSFSEVIQQDWAVASTSTGTRVGVIGTGSTGVQMIPVVAREAAHLTVCQRSPAYTLPWQVRAFEPGELDELKANYGEIRAGQHVGSISRITCGPTETGPSKHWPPRRPSGSNTRPRSSPRRCWCIRRAIPGYNGGNLPGKGRMYMGYTAGIPEYRRRCDEIAANGYVGVQARLGPAV